MSTDQVYDGSQPHWKETDPCRPVNAYGRSKLKAEQLIQAQWPRSVSLRSSIIVGPQPASPLTRTLFLQFVDAALTSGQPTSFFEDEWRCPVYVQDIVAVVQKLAAWQVEAGAEAKCGEARPLTLPSVLNMGGPDRLSRVDMALMVAHHRGHSPSLVRPAPSASVARGVASPQDISMDVSSLTLLLGRPPTPLAQVLEQIWPTCSAA
ncbi:methionine adenosyltransferase regulatory beta subunit-related [Haematococcus lacustris]|uniref:Methionine adenosyltransferase regulatory beta subunit-related n=1 Tax=Haematococcus lacustris TaxID=44745 RepID=A0A699YIY2_HAELA|nr:methionine adenosyltransferase regulatory beta subunit-related [Haematococcus lacustris]